MSAFDRRGGETRQKNGTFKSIEDSREASASAIEQGLT
jgi:hypothetical protein